MDCPGNQYCQAGQCVGDDDTDPGESCANDSDCDGGKCNSSGYCVDCLTNADCGSGQTCSRDQTCSGGKPPCTSDAECTNGTRCKISSNPKICVQCLEDSDCARSRLRGSSAKVCRDNVCTNPTGSCSSNSDCGSLVCSNGTCTGCTSNNQCASGQTCNTSTGSCGSGGQCSTAADCGGVACQNGKCENCTNDSQCTTTSGKGVCDPNTGKCGPVQCTTANDCKAGESCYQPGRCGPCIADNECRSGEYCYIAPNDTTGWCYAGSSGSCTTNAQCPADLVCYNKQCTTCIESKECDQGETCSWTGRCIGGNGSSGGCTSNSQCAYNQTCVNKVCATNPNTGGGSGSFGTKCTNTSQCAYGLTCAGLSYDTSVCTAVCVGSGNGGNDDCPSGYACVDWEDSTLDGLKFCMSKDQLGSTAMGYPFTTPPGGACSANSNACQSSVCFGNTCARLCSGDQDCGSGATCYAYPDPDLGYIHSCVQGSSGGPQGQGCHENIECDSGICVGECNDGQRTPCGGSGDCGQGFTCSGTCSNHCRSINDCPETSSCNFWPMYLSGGVYSGWTPVCSGAIYEGSQRLGEGCNNDADCDSEWCIDGTCTTPCATQDDCAAGGLNTGCTPVNFYSGNSPVYSGSFCL